jgi:hypothetical protein
VIAVQALDKRSFRLQHNRTPGRKLAAILWTQQAKQSWARFTGRPVLLRLTTSRHSKRLTNYLLDFEPLKTGYESLRQKSGINKTEQTGPRSGCIKSRLKLSRNSFLAEVGHRSSHRLSKHFPEISLDRFIVASSTQGPGSIPWLFYLVVPRASSGYPADQLAIAQALQFGDKVALASDVAQPVGNLLLGFCQTTLNNSTVHAPP